jgi:hypothetical protein
MSADRFAMIARQKPDRPPAIPLFKREKESNGPVL